MNNNIRFSEVVKVRFSDVEQKKLAAEFIRRFKKTGQRFIEKRFDDGEVLICNVTQKLFQIMFEEEW